MATKPQFWEDLNQAQERIYHTHILYDKKPAFVREIVDDGAVPRLRLDTFDNKGVPYRELVRMDDPKFGKFRNLPLRGWFNSTATGKCEAVYLARNAKRSRTHGLTYNNTVAYTFKNGAELSPSRDYNSNVYMSHSSYCEAHEEDGYPKLEDILLTIREGSAIAYSPTFCVYRCEDGVRWLYRKRNRIGMFIGADTLSLFPKLGFYREEIMSDKRFTLNNIQEF